MRRVMLGVLLAALVLSGCEEGDDVQLPVDTVQPESGEDGIQATGLLDGSRVAISRGYPTVVVGDCDANDGLDEDVCIVARTIDGISVTMVIENPDVLVPGETVEAGVRCSVDCDDVTEGAVVEFRIDGEVRQVQRGTFTVEQAGPRWVADFDLELPFGDGLQGSFDVAATPLE